MGFFKRFSSRTKRKPHIQPQDDLKEEITWSAVPENRTRKRSAEPLPAPLPKFPTSKSTSPSQESLPILPPFENPLESVPVPKRGYTQSEIKIEEIQNEEPP